MVCLGNICRSPLAEGILRDKVKAKGLDWEIDSAGTSSYHIGEKPDKRSILVAAKHGIDISNQRGRQFHFPDFDAFDIIYVMDSANYNDIIRQAENDVEKNKVRLILNEVKPGFNQSVPDPYWDDDGFEKVFQMLDAACNKIISRES